MVSKNYASKRAKPRSLFSGKFQTAYILYPFFGNIYADRCSIFLYKYNPQPIDMIGTSINQNYLICYLCLCIKSSSEDFLLEHLRRIRDASEVFWEICSDTIWPLFYGEGYWWRAVSYYIVLLCFDFWFCFVFVCLFVFWFFFPLFVIISGAIFYCLHFSPIIYLGSSAINYNYRLISARLDFFVFSFLVIFFKICLFVCFLPHSVENKLTSTSIFIAFGAYSNWVWLT